jgi:endonuclease III-like uncharacterized protein
LKKQIFAQKSQWLDVVYSNIATLKKLPYAMDRLGWLQEQALHIKGIGKATVEETFLYIEDTLDKL